MKTTIGKAVKGLVELYKKHIPANAWLDDNQLKVYVRITERYLDGERLPSIDIANVEVVRELRGNGIFAGVLADIEQIAQDTGRIVYVESILEPRLERFLQQRGYEEVPKAMPPCWFRRVK